VESAKVAFREILKLPNLDPLRKKQAELELSVLEKNIREESLKPDDRSFLQGDAGQRPQETESAKESIPTPEERIRAKRAGASTKYEQYFDHFDQTKVGNNYLAILRGWSSAVTLVEGGEGKWRGGGYFLIWQGKGIVIDPGFDFLRSFHDAGFHTFQIDAVIVSHNHPDHNNDLKPIDDLIYEAFWRKRRGPYAVFPDCDTNDSVIYAVENADHRVSEELHYSQYQKSNILQLENYEIPLPITITTFRAEHDENVPRSLGIVIDLLDENHQATLRIGYTGDTQYYDRLPSKLENCDILIAHISEPSEEELLHPEKLKKNHLGYQGVIKLLQGIKAKPKLVLIGEFWAGLEDTRIEIIQGLRERTGMRNIYPAGIGMLVELNSLCQVACTNCGKYSASVNVAPPKDSYGDLAYLCPTCIIPTTI
jgi:ribonuclease BN (tRNA processing enzyme)